MSKANNLVVSKERLAHHLVVSKHFYANYGVVTLNVLPARKGWCTVRVNHTTPDYGWGTKTYTVKVLRVRL